ncbi:VirD4-like conjugal transfer protein, CD1115 family [Culicoidibacter larvae]|uniref:Type IV secretory system conjugative DNA transfer family protein n=1 Tax=Culicoidibacter larvae TaxID=2579976 RepID=A0A5R8Q6Y8_9FIRM|nr:type IV secretory system conjugative DNA transfer family protein [Culicoidibacter larvae]TLG71156.1 hypothetical protein FEZ08_11420 [Culicoidibacter larvae]
MRFVTFIKYALFGVLISVLITMVVQVGLYLFEHGLFSFTDIDMNQIVWWNNYSWIIFGVIMLKPFVELFISVKGYSDHHSHGSARWGYRIELFLTSRYVANVQLINSLLSSFVPRDQKSGGGLVLKSNIFGQYVDADDNHATVIATTGGGKSQLVAIPTAKSIADNGESVIIGDVKGEIYDEMAGYFKSKGYAIKVLNLYDPRRSDSYNPMAQIIKDYQAGRVSEATTLLKSFTHTLHVSTSSGDDKIWGKLSKQLHDALFLALLETGKYEQVTVAGTMNLKNRLSDTENGLDDFFSSLPTSSDARRSYSAVKEAAQSPKTRSSIMINFDANLDIFNDRLLAQMTSINTIDIESIGKEKTAVFVIIPDAETSRHELVSFFIHQVYYTLVNVAVANGGRLPVRTNFLLDEFGNLPKIPEMKGKLGVSRSRGMRFYLFIQSFSQLYEIYGDHVAKSILDMTNDTIYIGTNGLETAENISKRIGSKTMKVQSRSFSPWAILQSNRNESNHARALLSADELMNRLKPNRIVLLRSKTPPQYLKLRPWWKQKPKNIEPMELPYGTHTSLDPFFTEEKVIVQSKSTNGLMQQVERLLTEDEYSYIKVFELEEIEAKTLYHHIMHFATKGAISEQSIEAIMPLFQSIL